MTSVVAQLGPDGAVVPIEVNLCAPDMARLRSAGHAAPTTITVPALIDTGADVTVLDPAVLTPLAAFGLRPTRFLFLNAPAAGGVALTPEYQIALVIGREPGRPRSGFTRPVHLVYERALGVIGCRALIGRDVLAHGAFFYDGPGGRVTLLL